MKSLWSGGVSMFVLLMSLLGCGPGRESSVSSVGGSGGGGSGNGGASTGGAGGGPLGCDEPPSMLPVEDLLFAVILPDLNGDGRPDIVTGNLQNNLAVMLNHGDATFTKVVHLTTGDLPYDVAAGDLNGDGKVDLVTANFYSSDASLILGHGDGTFAAEERLSLASEQKDLSPSGVVARDLDGDGKVDLAFSAVTPGGGLFKVLLGLGDGAFGPATTYPAGERLDNLAAADLDGDGRLDLLAPDSLGDTLYVLLNKGDGTFGMITGSATGKRPSSVIAADLDGDGTLEVVVTNRHSDFLSVYPQVASGVLGAPTTYFTGIAATETAVADLNGDGRLDLAVSRDTTELNDLAVLYAQSDGTFGPPQYATLAHKAYEVSAADLDGDGDMDLAVGSEYARVSVVLTCP